MVSLHIGAHCVQATMLGSCLSSVSCIHLNIVKLCVCVCVYGVYRE